MQWFGWLTKGRMEVSFLDEMIGIGEMFGVFCVGVFVYVSYCETKRFLRKRRK
jgi:hypothetical protein